MTRMFSIAPARASTAAACLPGWRTALFTGCALGISLLGDNRHAGCASGNVASTVPLATPPVRRRGRRRCPRCPCRGQRARSRATAIGDSSSLGVGGSTDGDTAVGLFSHGYWRRFRAPSRSAVSLTRSVRRCYRHGNDTSRQWRRRGGAGADDPTGTQANGVAATAIGAGATSSAATPPRSATMRKPAASSPPRSAAAARARGKPSRAEASARRSAPATR